MDEKEQLPQERKAADVRKADGTFGPGNAANPGGQPKWMKQVREGLKSMHPLAKDRLEKIIKDGQDKDAAAAIRVLYEFTLPKPKQRVKVEGNGASPLATLSLEDLLALGRGVKAAEPTHKVTHLECPGWSSMGPCGFATYNAALYADHLNDHHSVRALGWTCSCGRFGEGTDKVLPHTRPDGKPCNMAAGEKA